MDIEQPKEADFLNDFEKKHMPFVEEEIKGKVGDEIELKVKLGEMEHPTMSEHYIEWVALYNGDDSVVKKNIKPGGEPEEVLTFTITEEMKPRLRAKCSIHGIWERELDIKIK